MLLLFLMFRTNDQDTLRITFHKFFHTLWNKHNPRTQTRSLGKGCSFCTAPPSVHLLHNPPKPRQYHLSFRKASKLFSFSAYVNVPRLCDIMLTNSEHSCHVIWIHQPSPLDVNGNR